MPELRKDYLTNNWVVIAKIRAVRPSGYGSEETSDKGGFCPFCPGNEKKLSPAKLVYVKQDNKIIKKVEAGDAREENWLVKVLPNLYPAFSETAEEARQTRWNSKPAYGIHEVVIDTPNHYEFIPNMSLSHLTLLFQAYSDRFKELSKLNWVKFISISKNHGKRSGGTLIHPHSQIIALDHVPRKISEEFNTVKEREKCAYEDILEAERESERFVFENKDVAIFCPFASEYPYETWIFPKIHVKNICELNDAQLRALAKGLKIVVSGLSEILNNPSYNYIFYQSLDVEKYHMHIRVTPRFYHLTGFEASLNLPVNEVPPEEAAQVLRQQIEKLRIE
ncbi:MAG: galactose-1-phosphate uridylyltransferase [Candidatus Odinarchaeia archaeon]